MVRIKIVQKGWAGYTGNLGTTVFEDGIAECSELEATRIGANIQIVRLNEEDEDDGVINITHEYNKIKSVSAEVVAPLKTAEELAKLKADEPDEDGDEEPAKDEDGDDDDKVIWTLETLEQVADEKGIKGLREIGEPLGAKSVKISELIEKILEAQDAA